MEKELCWYVMRDLKRANAKQFGFQQLQEENIRVYTPLKEKLITRGGRTFRQEVPVIPDLLFVRASMEALEPVLRKMPTIQYRYLRGKGYRIPMTVDNREMELFIHAVSQVNASRFYLPEEITPEMCGKQIRIIGGELHNYEGRLLKRRGTRKKYLLVELRGCLFAEVEVEPKYIEFI